MFDLGWYRVVSIPEITSTLRRPPTLDPRPKRRLDRGMKATLFALIVALLMVGCGEPELSDPFEDDAAAYAVEEVELQDRNGVSYLQNTEEPYSGYAKRSYENGKIRGFFSQRMATWFG